MTELWQQLAAHRAATAARAITALFDADPQRARREGVLALQLHAGAPMWAEYKDIRIRNLE